MPCAYGALVWIQPPGKVASASAFAQTPAETIEKALAAAPRAMHDEATVIKWKADFTYETLKKGTNRLVCYDRTGQPGQQPFAVECTTIARAAFAKPISSGHRRDWVK